MAITSPTYCTGRELWRLGMPRTVSPADPGLSQGAVGPLAKVVAAGVGTLTVLAGAPTDTYAVRLLRLLAPLHQLLKSRQNLTLS